MNTKERTLQDIGRDGPAELLLPFQSEEARADDWMYEDDKREFEYDRELITARMG